MNDAIPDGFVEAKLATMVSAISTKYLKTKNIQITPITLNIKWAKAVLFADMFAGIAARFAVMVVPMFSPMIIAAALEKSIHPCTAMISVMATVALED